jgi:predicted amino acid dehydrogenase
MFACEADGVVPDLLLVAKALGGGLFPLGACLVSDHWWDERFALGHSSTFANNNVACAVGRAVLRALVDGDLPAQAQRRGERLGAGLRRLRARYPRVVADVRGRGLLWALELAPADDRQSLMLGYLQHHGLYAYAAAGVLAARSAVLVLPTLGTTNVLRVAPPLVVSDEQIDLILDGLESLCAQLARNPSETLVRALGWDRAEAATPVPVPPPPPLARTPGRRRWAFVVHYTRPEDVRVTEPGLARLDDAELHAFGAHAAQLPPGVCLRAPIVRSATGAEVEGLILALPLLPEEMLRRGRRVMTASIRQAVDLAGRLGADVVGLGGFTTPLSDRGRAVVGRGPLVTTGNALTAAAAFQAASFEVAARGWRWSQLRVAVLGARGSVGALLARLAAREQPARLILFGNPASDPGALQALARDLARASSHVEASCDPGQLATCDLVLSATGAARPVLDAFSLQPGAIVCDVARPPDAGPATRGRRDLTVVDGGVVGLPDPTLTFGPGNLQGLPPGLALACLSETILHALEGTRTNFGVGPDIPVGEADWALALCARHGFRVAPLHGDGGARAASGGTR